MDALFLRRSRAHLRDCLGYLGIAAATVPVGVALRASGWTPAQETVWAISAFAPVVATVLAARRESSGPLATPGKRGAGLRVVDAADGSSTFGRCLLRNAVKIAIPWQLGHTVAIGAAFGGFDRAEPVLVVVTVVTYAVLGGLLVSVLRSPGLGWHDRVARTRVVVGPSAAHRRAGGRMTLEKKESIVADPSTEPTAEPTSTDTELPADDYGTLTVEDADVETVDPADVAGTANGTDDEPPAR